jgi:hypothetical protein
MGCARNAGTSAPATSLPVAHEAPQTAEHELPLDAAAVAAMARTARGIDDLMHPELGMFVIENIAGVVPQLALLDRWPDEDSMIAIHFAEHRLLGELAKAESWEANYRPPEDECDDGSPSLGNAGVHIDWVLDVHFGFPGGGMDPDAEPWITRSYDDLVEEGVASGLDEMGMTSAPEHWSRLQTLVDAAARGAAIGRDVLYFGRIDDQWFLVGIDGRDDHCG